MDPFQWKALFSFSKRERRGIYTLLLILAMVLLFRAFMDDLMPPAEPMADSLFEHQVEQWLRESQKDQTPCAEKLPISPAGKSEKETRLFRFDPNRASRQQLEMLGLQPHVADNILKYRKKGGRFGDPRELLNIYGMDSLTYQVIRDSVYIEDLRGTAVMPGASARSRVHGDAPGNRKMDLNAADTFQLMQLPGIGPVFARRICKYRDLLGGFVHARQLHEVYGLAPSVADSLAKYLTIDTLHLRPIPINGATFRELIRHPYLGEYHTKAILNYRDYRNGRVRQVDELLKHNILDRNTYQKMEPYLVADP